METLSNTAPLRIRSKKGKELFRKVHDSKGDLVARGYFSLDLEVTALTEALYVPLSIASGKKPAGFVYQIEGTGESGIVTADITLKDAKESGVAQVLVGTIAYARIPKGATARFHASISVKGTIGKEYAIAITTVRYKFDPSDARYQVHQAGIRTGMLKFH